MLLRVHPRTRAAFWVSLAALGVHMVPFLFPRKVPSVELELAQLLPGPEERIPFLAPLRNNPQARGPDLRRAAELVLPASIDEARDFLTEAERRDPRSVDNELLRARICRAEGDDRCVQVALAHVRRERPNDPTPEILDADICAAQGDVSGTLHALERAVEKAPEDLELRRRLAQTLVESGQENAADAALAPLAKGLPRHRYLLERALLRLANGRNEAALSTLVDALAQEGAGAEARYYLGVAQFRLQDLASAEKTLREADSLDPTDFRSLALLCAIQRERGDEDGAGSSRTILERRFAARREEFAEACPP